MVTSVFYIALYITIRGDWPERAQFIIALAMMRSVISLLAYFLVEIINVTSLRANSGANLVFTMESPFKRRKLHMQRIGATIRFLFLFFLFSTFIYFVRAKELLRHVLLFFRFILAPFISAYVFNSKQLLYVTFAVNCKVTNCRQCWIELQTERMQIHSVKSNFVTSQLPRFTWQQSRLHGNSVSKGRSAGNNATD